MAVPQCGRVSELNVGLASQRGRGHASRGHFYDTPPIVKCPDRTPMQTPHSLHDENSTPRPRWICIIGSSLPVPSGNLPDDAAVYVDPIEQPGLRFANCLRKHRRREWYLQGPIEDRQSNSSGSSEFLLCQTSHRLLFCRSVPASNHPSLVRHIRG